MTNPKLDIVATPSRGVFAQANYDVRTALVEHSIHLDRKLSQLRDIMEQKERLLDMALEAAKAQTEDLREALDEHCK